MDHGNSVSKKRTLTFYSCHRCQHIHETFTGDRVCKMVYGKKDPPETVYKDEEGNYRCRHYKGRW